MINTITSHHSKPTAEGDHAFDQSSVLKVLIKNSFPIVMLMIANSFYTLIDALLAIKYISVDTHGYNGGDVVGAVFPLAQLLMAFSMFYVVGIGLYFSKRLGQGKYESAERGVGQAMMMSMVVGISLWVVLFFISGPYVNHIISSSDSFLVESDINPEFGEGTAEANRVLAAHAGRNFLLVIGLSGVPLSIMNCLVRALRSEGKGLAASLIPIIPIPLNLGFDIIMMGVFGTGIWGAAFATFLASLVTMLIGIAYVVYERLRDNTYISFKLRLWKPVWTTSLVIIAFGATSFIRRIGSSIVTVSLSLHITSLGTAIEPNFLQIDTSMFSEQAIEHFTVSFNAVTNSEADGWASIFNAMARTLIFQNRIALGIAQSVAMICAYHYGRKNWKRINSTLMWGFLGVVLVSGLMAVVLFGSSNTLVEVFGISGNDPNFNEYLICYWTGIIYVFMNGMVLIPIMYYSSSRNIRATLIHVIVITSILFGASIIGNSMVIHFNDEKAYFYTMLVGGLMANTFAVCLFAFNVHKMNRNVRLYGDSKKPHETLLAKEIYQEFVKTN